MAQRIGEAFGQVGDGTTVGGALSPPMVDVANGIGAFFSNLVA